MRSFLGRAGVLVLSVPLVLAAGCGGNGGANSATTGSASAAGTPKPFLRLLLKAPGGQQFTPSVSAKAKDAIQLVADFGSKNPSGKAKLTIPAGPAPSLKIKGHVRKGPTRTATINAPKGQKVGVQVIQYLCQLPPAKTFCPVKATAQKNGTATITAGTKVAVRLGIVLK